MKCYAFVLLTHSPYLCFEFAGIFLRKSCIYYALPPSGTEIAWQGKWEFHRRINCIVIYAGLRWEVLGCSLNICTQRSG